MSNSQQSIYAIGDERKDSFIKLRKVISYGMIGWMITPAVDLHYTQAPIIIGLIAIVFKAFYGDYSYFFGISQICGEFR